jgi:hypothetical protein
MKWTGYHLQFRWNELVNFSSSVEINWSIFFSLHIGVFKRRFGRYLVCLGCSNSSDSAGDISLLSISTVIFGIAVIEELHERGLSTIIATLSLSDNSSEGTCGGLSVVRRFRTDFDRLLFVMQCVSYWKKLGQNRLFSVNAEKVSSAYLYEGACS